MHVVQLRINANDKESITITSVPMEEITMQSRDNPFLSSEIDNAKLEYIHANHFSAMESP